MTIPLFTSTFLSQTQTQTIFGLTFSYPTIILGLALATYPFGQFLGSPILGGLSDRYGRKPTLIWSLGLSALFYILIALSFHLHSLTLLFVGLLLAGIVEGNIAIAQGSISDVARPEERAHLFGYIYISASSAYVVGPLLGGFIGSITFVSVPFWIMAVLIFLLTYWIQKGYDETHFPNPEMRPHIMQAFTNIINVFRPTFLRPYYGVNFLLYMAIFGFFRVYPMYIVDQFHTSMTMLSVFVAYVALPIILCNLFVIKWLQSVFTAKHIVRITAILFGIALICIIIPNSLHALWITLFVSTFFLALTMTFAAATISEIAPHDQHGRVMGNNQSLQVAAEALSGAFGGLIAALWIPLPFLACALASFIGGAYLFKNLTHD